MSKLVDFPIKIDISESEKNKRIIRTLVENTRPYIDPVAWEYVREETVNTIIKYFSINAESINGHCISIPKLPDEQKKSISKEVSEIVSFILKKRQAFAIMRVAQLYGEIYRLRNKLIVAGIDPEG